jgi:amidase
MAARFNVFHLSAVSHRGVSPVLLALVLTAGSVADFWARASIELTTASIADIDEAFSAGALTSERLTRLYLQRIEAYDKKGPALNAVLMLNPHALDDARALDAERKSKGARGPLHGIPVLLKANIETAGLPATAGFYGLRDSIANRDAEVTRRLRAAGCVILGLTNMSEFASGPAISTLGGQIRNPHALDRSPQGSSGGSAAAIAARFATFSIGTDTGGSVRGPSAVNGIAGLRPSMGLVGRGGIIPLALSLDTAGPMAPSVADLATVMNVIVGADPRDPTVADREAVDYRAELPQATLQGARLGLIRDYMGADSEADAVIEHAVQVLRSHGAEVMDVPLPRFVPGLMLGSYEAIRDAEFPVQIEAYLSSLSGDNLPRTHADIIQLGNQLLGNPNGRWTPNPVRLQGHRREATTSMTDQPYLSSLNEARTIVTDTMRWLLTRYRLDALISPTSRPARLIAEEGTIVPPGWRAFASMTGWPDLTVPVGFTTNPALPVGMSFLGPAFSEAKILGLGVALERALPVRRLPISTPPLAGERIEY